MEWLRTAMRLTWEATGCAMPTGGLDARAGTFRGLGSALASFVCFCPCRARYSRMCHYGSAGITINSAEPSSNGIGLRTQFGSSAINGQGPNVTRAGFSPGRGDSI